MTPIAALHEMAHRVIFAASLNMVAIGGVADIGRRWGPMPGNE